MSGDRFYRQRWFQSLILGLILFAAAQQALILTRGPNFLPTVLLIGAFLVPIVFVIYMYEHERRQDAALHRESPLSIVVSCFIIGGIIGTIVAGFLEFGTLSKLGVFGLVGVGFIEESAKLIFPVILYTRRKYMSEADGLLFGVTSGMGFAALETMGYGLVTFIQSQGSLGTLEEVLLVRGLFSPVAHAAWTGFVCAVLWREYEKRGKVTINFAVIGAFLLAILLHVLWDLVSVIGGPTILQFIILVIGYLTIGVIGLILIIGRIRESRHRATGA